jgi:carboxyl-terminal processing protease
MSNERLKNNSAFNLIGQDAQWLSRENDKVFPLNLQKYREEQKQIKATIRQIESLSKLTGSNELNVSALPQDAHKYDGDKDKADRFQVWLKDKRSDIYLGEAVNVLDDMITQKNLVYNK